MEIQYSQETDDHWAIIVCSGIGVVQSDIFGTMLLEDMSVSYFREFIDLTSFVDKHFELTDSTSKETLMMVYPTLKDQDFEWINEALQLLRKHFDQKK